MDETKSSGTDPPAVVSSFKGYDALDRLETETDAWGRQLFYDYDPQGNRTLLIDPDNKRTVYAYDELNRLETLTLDDQQAVTYEYFTDGLKKTVTNPNGTVSSYLYDAADRMDTITHVGPSGTISGYEYFYDASSNRERQVEQNAGRTEATEYTYDFVNRLKTVTYPDRTAEYEYDKSGNRIQEVTTGAEASDETFHYDAINRLERITDTTTGAELTRYAYDPNGNTTSKTKGGVTTTFHYDIRDQLGEVRQASNILGRYGYDYNGRRILKIGDDGRRQYTYDQLSVITEADQVNNTVSKYDYGMDQLVRLDNRAEGRSFFHLDGLRSTVGLTDATGGSRQSIFYDAWGNERDRIGSSANNFTFTGHELDEETGLIYAKARFYDPDIGRFLTQDSVLGASDRPPSLHRYFYSFSNPLRFVDRDGFEAKEVDEVQRTADEYLASLPDAERERILKKAEEAGQEGQGFLPKSDNAEPVIANEEGWLDGVFSFFEGVGEFNEGVGDFLGEKWRQVANKWSPAAGSRSEYVEQQLEAANFDRPEIGSEFRETTLEAGRKGVSEGTRFGLEWLEFRAVGTVVGGAGKLRGTAAPTKKPGLLGRASTRLGLGARRMKDRFRFGGSARFSDVRPSQGGSFFDIKGIRPRGEAIETALGKNTPGPFRTFDRLEPGDAATSIKSVDLTLPSALDPAKLRNNISGGGGYIDQVLNFPGESMKGITLDPTDVRKPVLELVIQAGKATSEQARVLKEAVKIGASNGIEVLITVIP